MVGQDVRSPVRFGLKSRDTARYEIMLIRQSCRRHNIVADDAAYLGDCWAHHSCACVSLVENSEASSLSCPRQRIITARQYRPASVALDVSTVAACYTKGVVHLGVELVVSSATFTSSWHESHPCQDVGREDNPGGSGNQEPPVIEIS